jgi:hypothetical protein
MRAMRVTGIITVPIRVVENTSTRSLLDINLRVLPWKLQTKLRALKIVVVVAVVVVVAAVVAAVVVVVVLVVV